ncbi:glycine-rich domain-containing protein [Pseudoduganella buxea]|uniref:Glycine-rich domain-containing protein-like n=1 Tax=Pseudoduganella buxea TaxID=1949069 RepID=A0A6I3ST36_9BURK|nr:hypothetical protein [Pseudoduganella buxea]MTV51805.1 hypothetical protein [Pseudoduganella buxea]GGC12444.1 hypothetical protein GCM10011572_37360 [Pseudoduganella buxea]
MHASDFAAIAELDLEPIKVKLMHEESGEGWTLEQANAVEFEYRRFLYLMKKFPNEQTAPLQDVDTFWHYHILDTLKYAADCDKVFGYFLHHFPYIGLRGEADEAAHHRVGERMKELYETTFDEPYLRASRSAFSGVAANQQAFSGSATTADKVAFSGSATTQAKVAFSGSATTQAKVAFSGSATAPAKTAFSRSATALPFKTAFSGSATGNGRVAFSGSATGTPARTAFSGSATGDSFYVDRPRLTSSA